MTHFMSGARSFVASLATLPQVGWSFGARYNPKAVEILQAQGLSRSEAIQIASNPEVRGFSSRLRQGSTLFMLGAGGRAQTALRDARLLIENPPMTISLGVRSDFRPALVPARSFSVEAASPTRTLFATTSFLTATDQVSGTGAATESPSLAGQLIALRGLLADKKYFEASEAARKIRKEVDTLIAQGADVNDRMLAYHYFLTIVEKKLSWLNKAGVRVDGAGFMFREGRGKHSTQIMVVDSKRERLLMQHRGLFKRLFADTWTVSANCKPGKDDDVRALAAEALKKETGLEIDSRRFESVGRVHGFHNHLVSYDFYAFTPEEEQSLRQAASDAKLPDGVKAKFDERRRSLFLYSLNPLIDRDEVAACASAISAQTLVPHVFPVYDVDDNSLLVVQLSEAEDKLAEELAAEKRGALVKSIGAVRSDATGEVLKDVDSDEMAFFPIKEVRHAAEIFSQGFALDLIGPYLHADQVWARVAKPHLLGVDAPAAQEVGITGGKGANTHILRTLAKTHPELKVPDTEIVSTYAFDDLVLSHPVIKAKIAQLEKLNYAEHETEIIALCESIRSDILTLELPDDLKEQVAFALNRLGGSIAVRSSATVEDTKASAAAGQADSFLDITDPAEAARMIKKVWASLFSDGFVKQRNNKHDGAKMAVLLQSYIPAVAAGVVTSITPKGRPVYTITAKAGIGENVVQGKGNVDTYQVGLLADAVLEEQLEDGVLSNAQVLELARIIKLIYEHYRKEKLADNVDVEFVFDGKGFSIVQTRAEQIEQIVTREVAGAAKAGSETKKTVMKVEIVDVDKVPPGTVIIELDPRAIVAQPGAVSAPLQYVESHRPNDSNPGVILLTEHTANSWNAQFTELAGVITTDGGSTSHAAKNSRVLRKPCLVGVPQAIELLRRYDGQVVTLDSDSKRIYIGKMPTKTVERDLSIWVSDMERLSGVEGTWERHEALMDWQERKDRRPGITVEDLAGHWRGRSGPIPPFALDYYYRAWDRLTDYLNTRFSGRAPFVLPVQPREIKEGVLFHEVLTPDDRSIFAFLAGLHKPDLSIADAEALLSERVAGFRQFSTFLSGVTSLNRTNVEQVVDELINVFSWMHFAFWLNSVVDTKYLKPQARYLGNEYREPFTDAAVAASKPIYHDDLSREKDKAIRNMLERIISNPAAYAAFDRESVAAIKLALGEVAPDLLETINGWSHSYKAATENLATPSDTLVYLTDISKRLQAGTFLTLDLAVVFVFRQFGPVALKRHQIVELLEQPKESAYLMGYARKLAAEAALGKPLAAVPEAQRAQVLSSLSAVEVTSFLGQAIDEVLAAYTANVEKIRTAADILKDNPNLQRTLSLSWQETYLREDGHHIIVPLQRKLASMMLEAAKKRPELFAQPEEVFQLSTYELVALVKERNPRYLSLTKARIARLRAAEAELVTSWSIHRRELPGRLQNEPEDPTGKEKTGFWRTLEAAGYIKDSYVTKGNLTDASYQLSTPEELLLPFPYGAERTAIFQLIQRKKTELPAAVEAYAKEAEVAIATLQTQIRAASNQAVKEYYREEIQRIRARVQRLREQLKKRGLVE